MRDFLIFVLLSSLPYQLTSQNFKRIDSLSIQLSDDAVHSENDLVTYCEANASTDLERVRFYFVWIATHVDYDAENLEPRSSEKLNSAADIFTQRKAVCSGFAALLAQFCAASGIPARYVSGYGRDADDPVLVERHAWNVIKIGERWHHFDVTWAANALENRTSDALNADFEQWFQSPRSVFLAAHLPFDPAFQLADEPISREEYQDSQS